MDQYQGSFGRGGDPDPSDTSVAIVGMACRFAQARSIDEYWQLLREGREAVETFSDDQLTSSGVTPATYRRPDYVRRGAPLEDMECFDAPLFGMSARDAAIMDPQHRHFLECSWEAFENAGHCPRRFGGTIGVFAGSGHNAYLPYNLLTNPKLVRDVGRFLLRHTGNDKDFLPTRVSYFFDLKGPSVAVQTACSTSLVAIHLAAQSLINGECDMALAGGASIELPHRQGYVFEEGEILSPDGRCRPFDASSKGTVFGSGIGAVVLRRLSDAVADGDHIYAVVRGSAVNNDGAGKVGYLAPSVDGQAAAIAEALAIAGIDAGTIDYVEAHGTGTPVGDPIEVAALTEAFRETTDQVGRCGIGSAKANIGHTDTAAGVAGVIKVALAMTHGELPPSINFTAPNPDCQFAESPFHVHAQLTDWQRRSDNARRAGVSSLGVGGTNAHVVLEEAPQRTPGSPSRRHQLLLFSGRSESAAGANALALAQHLGSQPELDTADVAFTLAMGRDHLAYRRYAVSPASGGDPAIDEGATRESAKHPRIEGREVAFLFCGAGPQHIDMARGLYQDEPLFRREVDKALLTLERVRGPAIKQWLFPTDQDRDQARCELERPSIALPALFVIQTALARFWISLGVKPSAMIGHSSGEYAAAHLSGVLDLEDGLRIVCGRGRLFETLAEGAMLSVALAETELLPLLPPGLSISAINAPKLCVVSGTREAILRFRDELAGREIEAQLVRISVAAHSAMVDPILPEFRNLIDSIRLRAPSIPFVSNGTGDWVTAQDVTQSQYWVRHLRETVRFTDGVKHLLSDPKRLLLEVGPGRSMGSLAKQHPDRQRQQPVLSSMRHPDQPVDDQAFLLETLGELWALGIEVDWQAYWADEQRLRVPLPTYRFERQRHWIEPGLAATGSSPERETTERLDLDDWCNEPVWSRSPNLPAAVRAGTALILDDRPGLGQAIAARLKSAGCNVVMVYPGSRFKRLAPDLFAVQPTRASDYGRLLDSLRAEGREVTQIYHCWLVTGAGRTNRLAGIVDRGLQSLIAMAPELAHRTSGEGIEMVLVTDRAQRIGGDLHLVPEKATALGAVRVVSAEYPDLHVRTIDVGPTYSAGAGSLDSLADAVVSEVAATCEWRPIAYRAGERWVLDYLPSLKPRNAEAAADAATAPWDLPGGTYVVTGGLGGLGLTLARHLAPSGAKLMLVSRSPLPPREQWLALLAQGSSETTTQKQIREIVALEVAGAKVEFMAADVADTRAMRRVFRRAVKMFGPITGVFHAAGTLDVGLIDSAEPGLIETVLRPKVAGTRTLEKVLQEWPSEFLVLFSSISAFVGIPGQVGYAAANAFLDCYAQSPGLDGTRVLSIGWSEWAEVGMAARFAGGTASRQPAFSEDDQAGEPIDHPFLQKLQTLSPDEHVATATLTPEEHWLLDEHRLSAGGALLPGTGYLELARATLATVDPGPAELSDVTFLAPFAVPDGTARALRVQLHRRIGQEWRFAISGRSLVSGPQEWVEHATGLIRTIPAIQSPARFDVDRVAARCSISSDAFETSEMMRFGPRWAAIRRVRYGDNEALLELELDRAYHGDLSRLALHPALLDLATAGGQSLVSAASSDHGFFAPFAYGRLTQHQPLPAVIVSHIRYRPNLQWSGISAVFDITIADLSGNVVAEVDAFTMMRIVDPLVLTATPKVGGGKPSLGSADHSAAILPEEGMAILDRLIAGPANPHVVISPYDLASTMARLRMPPRVVRHESAVGQAGDLPRTATEQSIADLWADLLGTQDIGRTQDFFDLGGHSLLAVQFINRLRKTTGHALPVAAMLECPTVAGIAHLIDPDARPAMPSGDAATSDADSERQAPIVTIRAGGSDTPIFFVHDGLGETLLYRGLAHRLDPARAIYGIEPLRSVGGNFAHTRIDEMAEEYIARVKSIQPDGPYFLAGLCAGGVIAFEMAQKLRRGGATVAFLAIIDAADVAARKKAFYNTRARLSRIRMLLCSSSPLTLIPKLCGRAWSAARWEIGSRVQQALDHRAVERMRSLGGNELQSQGEQGTPLPFLKLYEVAHRLHQPSGILTGPAVVLFKASDDTGLPDDLAYALVYRDIALGWGLRVGEEIAVVSVPGGHMSLLQEPYVCQLAVRFQEAVDCAAARFDPRPETVQAESAAEPALASALAE